MVFLIASCGKRLNDSWDSSIINIDSISTDASKRKVAVANYLDSAKRQTFLAAPICLSPIIDTSTQYLNQLFNLPDSIKSKFHAVFDRSRFRPVNLKNYSFNKVSWCDDFSEDKPGGFLEFYNACRLQDQATVTVSLNLLPRAGKVFTLFLEKDALNKWKTSQIIKLAVF